MSLALSTPKAMEHFTICTAFSGSIILRPALPALQIVSVVTKHAVALSMSMGAEAAAPARDEAVTN